ncbi:hypothetical protein [Larkinella rosea]|uniref:Uncharacterized protein n=1 Tax=Larkinella rosea TaxID=2025312 RepID=A0A3P1C0E6_9BACT|nr:hypothetical protein [Larkinella rosea]RRB06880.1 hypothetical protein EHT25_03575 [Larkinella rosea]
MDSPTWRNLQINKVRGSYIPRMNKFTWFPVFEQDLITRKLCQRAGLWTEKNQLKISKRQCVLARNVMYYRLNSCQLEITENTFPVLQVTMKKVGVWKATDLPETYAFDCALFLAN